MAHRNVSKGNRWEEMKCDGTRCALRTSSPRVGFSPTPSPPREKQTTEEEEGEHKDDMAKDKEEKEKREKGVMKTT